MVSRVTIFRGVRSSAIRSRMRAAAAPGQLLALRAARLGRAVVGQRQAQHLHQAVHRVRGEHPGAGAAGGAGQVFERLQLLVVDLPGLVGAHALEHAGQVDGLALGRAPGGHGPAGHEDGGDVDPHRGHQHPRRDLVAVGDAHHAVEAVGAHHGLDGVGDDLARGQAEPHPAVAHGDAVVHADGVELEGHAPPPRGWPVFTSAPKRLQVRRGRARCPRRSSRRRRTACPCRRRSGPTAFSRLRCGARSTPVLIRSDLMPPVPVLSTSKTPPKTKTPEVSLGGLCDLGLGWP